MNPATCVNADKTAFKKLDFSLLSFSEITGSIAIDSYSFLFICCWKFDGHTYNEAMVGKQLAFYADCICSLTIQPNQQSKMSDKAMVDSGCNKARCENLRLHCHLIISFYV